MATNDFLPFCGTNTGTNLLSQGDYVADSQRPIGNQTGVARSKLVNKALRQATYIAGALSQFLSNVTGDDVLDNNTQSDVLTTMNKAFKKAPTMQKFLTGSGTYNRPANVLYLRVRLVGPGGGGSGGGASYGAGAAGTGSTTFGSSLLVGGPGDGGNGIGPYSGGTASLGIGPLGIAVAGSGGMGGALGGAGGAGASTPFGGGGSGGDLSGTGDGFPAAPNSGSGGGAAQTYNATGYSGASGAAGGYVEAIILTPSASYAYSVGVGGAGGTAGTMGGVGGAGAAGMIIVEEYYS